METAPINSRSDLAGELPPDVSGFTGRAEHLARANGNRNGQFEALFGIGHTLQAAGQSAAAATHHQQALTLAMELGQPRDQARAHDGLAMTYHHLGQHHRAREHWTQAAKIFNDLGAPEATQIRARLEAGLDAR